MSRSSSANAQLQTESAMDLAASHAALLNEIRALREELRERTAPSPSLIAHDSRPQFKIAIDRVVGERKPFVLRCSGILDLELKLSSMRAALLLALLLDLQNRGTGGPSYPDSTSRMLAVYRALEGSSASDDQLSSVVRVGLYRLELSLHDEPLFVGPELTLAYNAVQHRFEIAPQSALKKLSEFTITISSSDPKILACIDSQSAISPLDRARQQNSMYVSSGERGWDQLFLEFFNHKLPVKNTSLFYRPALPTYSDELLAHIKASPATVARKHVQLEGYRSGRVQFEETLNRQTLWDMITTDQEGVFRLYPPGTTKELVASHIREIQKHLELYEQYSLALTDAVFPFIVGVVEITRPESTESFTMFYRQPPDTHAGDVTCFVLYDPAVAHSVLSRVISTVREHPSTVSTRAEVQAELAHVLDYLETQGPLVK